MTTPTLKRELKGVSIGGQFADSVSPESTLALRDVGEIVLCDSVAGRAKRVNDVWEMEWR